MSRLKNLITEDAVHERRIEVRTYPAKDDRVVVEGWLRDERFCQNFHWSGKERQPGIVHHMCVRMLVGDWPLTILDAEAEMPGVPESLCLETKNSVEKIIGMKIVGGYSDEVRRRLGGVKGCTHLSHLIVVMGPAALHGFWAQAMRRPQPVPESVDKIPGLELLVNSCQLWAEDGPFLEMIKQELAQKKPQS